MISRWSYSDTEKARIAQEMANMHPPSPPMLAGFIAVPDRNGRIEAGLHWRDYKPEQILAREISQARHRAGLALYERVERIARERELPPFWRDVGYR